MVFPARAGVKAPTGQNGREMTEAGPPLQPMEPVPWPAGFDDPGWCWQLKWDGVRCLADTRGGRLWSRSGRLWTGLYPELAAELAEATRGDPALLDGEIVALDAAGRPSFPLVLRRALPARADPGLPGRIPVVYAVFDVLGWNGVDLRPRPLSERLTQLARLTATAHIRAVATRAGGGGALVAAAAAAGLEGAVGKRSASPYTAGRSPDWRKVKPRRSLRAAVVGARLGEGGRLRSLALACPLEGLLAHIGDVGAGISQALRGQFSQALPGLPAWRAPFPTPAGLRGGEYRWFGPLFTATVTYSEWTPSGRLRNPVLTGLDASAPAWPSLPPAPPL